MKFRSLDIENLRAVEKFRVDDLKSFVVVAGQNGSGKSCVFDAIRLLKSFYGGYSANEYHQWFGEFAINLQDRKSLSRMFRDPARNMDVSAEIEFHPDELAFVANNLEDLAMPIAWQQVTGQAMDYFSFSRMSVATQIAQFKPQLDAKIAEIGASARTELIEQVHRLGVRVTPDGELQLQPSLLAQLIFGSYRPEALGVIEHHAATRAYAREDLGGVNLNTRTFADQRRQFGLYNTQAKFQNVKSELASSYVQALIAAQTGTDTGEVADLNSTLSELFRTFFPDKRYLGVQPRSDGGLDFPVELQSGRTHDIDDLSSGEKEILYGYLRLRNSTPRHSVILLDEPELHLNPGLLHGFADFYYRHLGVAQDNQLWMVTHSDTLLRQAVGNSNYGVYHMTPATAADTGDNQASEVLLSNDVERATIDLVGDLASYRPHAKVVILEGAASDGFDVSMIRRLFPNFARRVNLVSGGNKAGVRGLYEVLAHSAEQVGIENRFFAITDRDRESLIPSSTDQHVFMWDRYHIENFLLEPAAILPVVRTLNSRSTLTDEAAILGALHEAARTLVDRIVMELLQDEVNADLVGAIKIAGPPDSGDPASALFPSIGGSAARVTEASQLWGAEQLAERAQALRDELTESLGDGTWRMNFPGRLVIRRFISDNLTGIAYEPFANLVLEKLVELQIAPSSMAQVIQDIEAR